MKYIEMFFDDEHDMFVLEEPYGTVTRLTQYQLREAREVLHKYDEANFHPTSDENEIAFRFFTKRMGELSPEAQDVESPYLN